MRGIGRCARSPGGETIVAQWEASKDFYVVLAGRRREHRPERIRQLGPGEFFGELAALDWGSGFGYPRLATVVAASDVRLLRVPCDVLNELVRANFELERAIGRVARERLRIIADVIDPLERWRELGDKPDYAGLLTFGGLPYTQDPAELDGVDVAIVGAPTDDLVSDRPGARFAPRAIRAASCPPGPHLEAEIDATAVLRIVDFGDAAVIPADPVRTHAAIERTVGEVVAAGAVPIVLGGDHSIAEPDIRACAAPHGTVGLVHFDTHTDTGTEVFGVERSHGTPMYRLVEDGIVDPRRYVQIGLRGYWPGEREFAWQRERGITSFFMHDVRELGIDAVVRARDRDRRRRPRVPVGRRRRARPGVRARHRHPRARRDDERGSPPGVPKARRAARPRGRGGRRGDPDGGRLGRRDGTRRRADRPRDPHRPRAAQGRLTRRARLSTTCRPRTPRTRSVRPARG